ncbi:MAG: Ribosome-associated heat shock protein [Ilumatobacteraceae bacterium]|nr:Ribosome-associated heat shock protein [Ilumatobacteraceae bacterium]
MWMTRTVFIGFADASAPTDTRWDHGGVETTRVDKWLWAVRLYKTRSAASDACAGGHVTVNGSPAKGSTKVHEGDRVEARVAQRDRVLEVVRILEKRVGAPIAAQAYVDHSPPAPPPELSAAPLVRDRGAGRPTKRDRRAIDRLQPRRSS